MSGYAGFIHTTPASIGMVDTFMRRLIPDIAAVHVYDGTVKIENFRHPVGVTPKRNLEKWASFGGELERFGCSVVVSCCSLMPRATAFAAQAIEVPFVQLDEPILERAARNHSRIGAINTTEYTVPYIRERFAAWGEKLGKKIDVEYSNTTDALPLFNAGDFAAHDTMVLTAMRDLERNGVECIVLAQVPFGLLEDQIAAESWSVPVLVPGTESFLRLKELLL